MIKSIRCDKSSFKTINFEKGFNIIIAERTKESTERDSRNGLGKTTFIEIIHFCLGSVPDKQHPLRKKELENWTFMLDLSINGKEYTISRNTSNSSKIFIDGDFSSWPLVPNYDENLKKYYYSPSEWTDVLGHLLFGLYKDELELKYCPTFRSLISYYIRKGVEGFHSPFMHHPQQRVWDIQVNNCFLLGLNWKIGSEFQIIKDKEKTLKELKIASESGLLNEFIGSLGELEAIKIQQNERYIKLSEQLKNYKVHQQYYQIQEEADALTKEIHELINKNTMNKKLVSTYENSISEEKDIPLQEVENIYNKAGLLFSDKIKKRLNDVAIFHEKIISNRREYLDYEIKKLKRELKIQEENIELKSGKRAELFKILEEHKALDDYTNLQNRLLSIKDEINQIQTKIDNINKFNEGSTILKIEKQELLQKARRELKERTVSKEKAIKLFNQNSQFLYSEPGILSIDVEESGYKFNVEIPRAASQGVKYMKVFCYDLVLTQINSEVNPSMFLIHDSTIFDGVDERQIAKAIELAERESSEKGFQYICTMNSDVVPFKDFSEDFKSKFDDYVRIKFTDAKEDGGLLGIRF